MKRKTNEELKKEAILVGLSFSDDNYINNITKCRYVCNIHGDIYMLPIQVTRGAGCKFCSKLKTMKSKDKLIQEASLVNLEFIGVYTGTHKKALYKCKKHGEILISPHCVMSGQGCRECANHGFKYYRKGCLYVLICENKDDMELSFIGFGISNNLKLRLKLHKIELKKFGFYIKDIKTFHTDLGEHSLWLERLIKKEMREFILNTKIPGFKTEAIPLKYSADLRQVLQNGVEYLQANGVVVTQL